MSALSVSKTKTSEDLLKDCDPFLPKLKVKVWNKDIIAFYSCVSKRAGNLTLPSVNINPLP